MLRGLYYEVEERLIQIFGAEGMEIQNGQWLRNTGGHDSFKEISPCSCTMDQIDSCITEVVESGQGDKIAQLQLGAQEAVTLFLEGMLTIEHFARAYEESGFVILPEVRIPGGIWLVISVRVTKKRYGIALVDSEGKEIKSQTDTELEVNMPDEVINQAGGELIFAILGYGNGTFNSIDIGEEDAIARFEEGFAAAA